MLRTSFVTAPVNAAQRECVQCARPVPAPVLLFCRCRADESILTKSRFPSPLRRIFRQLRELELSILINDLRPVSTASKGRTAF